MKYFFSTASSDMDYLVPAGATRFLMSFMVDAKSKKLFLPYNEVIVDSGAFSAWNSGKRVDINAYIRFCNECPSQWVFVNLDVIPTTGSSKAEVENCAELSFANYQRLCREIKGKVLPVYHYGENIAHLQRYAGLTDYIGLSPANDTHGNTKTKFLNQCYGALKPGVKTHGFGYTSEDGLTRFPFYSVDSISYKRIAIPDSVNTKAGSIYRTLPTRFFAFKRVKGILANERFLTELWKARGVSWDD